MAMGGLQWGPYPGPYLSPALTILGKQRGCDEYLYRNESEHLQPTRHCAWYRGCHKNKSPQSAFHRLISAVKEVKGFCDGDSAYLDTWSGRAFLRR